MVAHKNPTPEAIKIQLEEILNNVDFKASEKLRNFLGFIVNETLEGRSSELKGYTIATSVYGRTEKFDPQTDPIVRVEAGRLRRALDHYYLTAGKDDPVRIEVPKGRYIPVFQTVRISPSDTEIQTSEIRDTSLSIKPSVAVLPLINLTNEQDYFADGLTEELITELARYQEFQVIASHSTIRFKGRDVDPKEAGRQLGVRFLLAGSVRKNLKAVKVSIQLLDTSTSEQIWGESYKRDLTANDLIAVQEKIAYRVIGTIADRYGLITRKLSRESRKKVPKDLTVYDAILQFYHFEIQVSSETFRKALAALEQAVEIDPEYGLAWAMLGHLYADNHAVGFCDIEAPLEKALTFAQKGVSLEPQNQFAQDALTLVHFHRGDKESFLKHVEQTLELNPNSPYIVGVAGWHMMLFGEWDRGLALLKKGMKLNPYYPDWFHLAPFMGFYHHGEYDKAFAQAERFNCPELFWDPLMRAAALGQIGRELEAGTAVGELLKLVPDFTEQGRQLIGNYVKVDDLVDKVIDGLRHVGLADLK